MAVDIAFIIDPIASLDPGHDTSVALMEAAQAAGAQVWVTEISQLLIREGQVWAAVTPIQLSPVQLVSGQWQIPQPWFQAGAVEWRPLNTFRAVWMRKDPPVNTAYLYATYCLDFVDPQTTLVLNSPAGLRHANEKMYALQFPSVIPKTIVTGDKQRIREFVQQQGMAVLKPLGGKAGEGILFLRAGDRNLNSMIEISTQRGQLPVMVQEYLPAAKEGDKRIILLNGEPIGAVNRIPTGDEFRGNMAAGGQVAAVEITERDRQICQTLAPALQRDGLYFVGIDVIGGYLTEVNVTSPTGVREIDRLNGTCLARRVMAWLLG
ncbi:glutathione synthase [Thermosynechococcus sp.]|uniref:glutathione synthase n=1 Tax=Thermosynechococcus sp. TaxID=2814275 RepID=UPI0039193819